MKTVLFVGLVFTMFNHVRKIYWHQQKQMAIDKDNTPFRWHYLKCDISKLHQYGVLHVFMKPQFDTHYRVFRNKESDFLHFGILRNAAKYGKLCLCMWMGSEWQTSLMGIFKTHFIFGMTFSRTLSKCTEFSKSKGTKAQ